MVEIRIEEKQGFRIVGRKTWISGTDNELFGQFWQKCREDDLFDIFKELRDSACGVETNSMIIGVSCVEDDPSNRSFNFYIGIESDKAIDGLDLEEYTIPSSKWAIFKNKGEMPDSLIEAEMYAFTKWLPNSRYIHANAPEMEVYPPCEGTYNNILVEFWLPIVDKI